MPTILCQLLLALLRQQFLRFYYIHYHGSLTLLSSWKMVQASIPQCKLQGKMILNHCLFFFFNFWHSDSGAVMPCNQRKT